jgi:hypothetical protein
MNEEVIKRNFKQDRTGCEHSNLDGPVARRDGFEEFRCPICSHLIRRKLDKLGKPTGESHIVEMAPSA